MNNIICSEVYKVLRNKAILGIIIATACITALLDYLLITDWWQFRSPVFEQLGLEDFKVLSVYFIPILSNLFLSFIASFLITDEFKSHGVIKNQVMSGVKRSQLVIGKSIVFSVINIITIVLVPLWVASIMAACMGDIQTTAKDLMTFLQAYGLFALNIASFSTVLFLIASMSKDTGKTIIYSILLTIAMFGFEKMSVNREILQIVFDQTIFANFTQITQLELSSGEKMHIIITSLLTIFGMTAINIYVFKKKEIN